MITEKPKSLGCLRRQRAALSLAALVMPPAASAEAVAPNVNVDVNLNIEHIVGGVSDFGRERHITVHAAISEPDWNGELDKMDYLLNGLDAYLGRDNGSATFHFAYTPQDPSIPNYPDITEMGVRSDFWKTDYESLGAERLAFESRATEMIMGTNPHPTYPTLSWYANGLTAEDPKWQPKNVETSADWVVEFLDKFFAKNPLEDGKPLPKYWEVINEPDMLMMTGQFMVTSQEKIWEYHNLVAEGVRDRLGDQAPMIGGMTWGLHDFFLPDGLSRYESGYLDQYLDEPTQAIHHAMSDSAVSATRSNEWYQWDVMWKGFMDTCGANMDFYSVHIYDWPKAYGATSGGTIRSGGHVEAMLDMMEWYDLHTTGERKPIVLSEYGAVGNAPSYLGVPARGDWEHMKPFSAMLMQFLERPDYIIKSMPFTPIKAEWGDLDDTPAGRYAYTLMDEDSEGEWQWTEYIKWFELWSDVNGTRIDTRAGDLDIQVDAYVDGDTVHLILNNLERSDRVLNLNLFGESGNPIQDVRIKHLHLVGDQPTLTDTTVLKSPSSVVLGAEATMILAYRFAGPLSMGETSNELKYMGESLSGSDGSTPHRVSHNGTTMTAQVNGVTVPAHGEAMLRICGAFFWTHVSNPDPRNVITINGHDLDFDSDWRGEDPGRPKYFGVLEVPVPLAYLQEDNTIQCTLLNQSEYTNVSLQVWDMSVDPQRSEATSPPDGVAVTGVTVAPETASVDLGNTTALTATVAPADATNQFVTWSSGDPALASVSSTGVVTPLSPGEVTITATTADGGFTDAAVVTINGTAVAVTGITLAPPSLSLGAGASAVLVPSVVPANASNKSVTWTSSHPLFASVTPNGMVMALAEGESTITAETVDGGFTASSVITVTAAGGGPGSLIAGYIDGSNGDSSMPAFAAEANVTASNVVNTAFSSGPVRNSWGASLGDYWITSAHNGTNASDIGAAATHAEVEAAKGYRWTVTANAGHRIDLSSMTLDFGLAAAADSQPTSWGYRVFVNIDGTGFISVGSAVAEEEVAGGSFVQKTSGNHPFSASTADGGSVTIKLVDWGRLTTNGNQYGTSANLFQNIRLNGSVESTTAGAAPIRVLAHAADLGTGQFTITYDTTFPGGVDVYYTEAFDGWTFDGTESATGNGLSLSRPMSSERRFYILTEPGVTP
ncbi:MAG: Ig-like domain-containing protein [Verrucomicrobiota bacterium]